MADPPRLRDELCGQASAWLLEVAGDDAPPEGAKARVFAALGLSTGTTPAGGDQVESIIGASVSTQAKIGASVSAWVGMGLAAGVCSIAVYWVQPAAKEATRDTHHIAAHPQVQPELAAPPTRAIAGAGAQVSTWKDDAPPPKRKARRVAIRSASLADEVVALDAVRAAVRARDGTRALQLLGLYSRDFPAGELVPEAAVLRVEALLVSGQRADAEKAARDFLQAQPSSHYADVISQRLQQAAP